MKITLDQFGGVAPKISPHLLPPQLATVARNCRFGSGSLEAWNAPLAVSELAKEGTIQSLYRYVDLFWFHWTEDVDVVSAPVALDTFTRRYWTGEDYPRVGGNDVVIDGGSTVYPYASYRMGVPAPETAPSAVAVGTPSDTLPPVERVYVVTFVNGYGGEGPPSDPSAVVEVANGQSATVTLPGVPGTAIDENNVVSMNIYRTEKGSSTSEYLLVGNAVVGTATFADTKLAEELSVILPSLLWDGPPDNMTGLVEHPMGSLVGFSGKEVLFSEPYRPHAWPYRYAVADHVVALGVYGSYVLVTTTGKPYIISGSDPSAMSVDRLERGEACVSKRGMVDMGPACIYPGPSGLWGASMSEVTLLTDKILSYEQWQAYKPDSITGTMYDGDYIGFYGTGTVQGGFVFNPSTGDFNEIDTHATAVWHDPKTGKLYLVVDGLVVEWNGGTAPVSYQWKSRPFLAQSLMNVSCGKVTASSYPVTLKVYADTVLKHTQTVRDAGPFWLPPVKGLRWECELTGTKTVNVVTLASSMAELQAG